MECIRDRFSYPRVVITSLHSVSLRFVIDSSIGWSLRVQRYSAFVVKLLYRYRLYQKFRISIRYSVALANLRRLFEIRSYSARLAPLLLPDHSLSLSLLLLISFHKIAMAIDSLNHSRLQIANLLEEFSHFANISCRASLILFPCSPARRADWRGRFFNVSALILFIFSLIRCDFGRLSRPSAMIPFLRLHRWRPLLAW